MHSYVPTSAFMRETVFFSSCNQENMNSFKIIFNVNFKNNTQPVI